MKFPIIALFLSSAFLSIPSLLLPNIAEETANKIALETVESVEDFQKMGPQTKEIVIQQIPQKIQEIQDSLKEIYGKSFAKRILHNNPEFATQFNIHKEMNEEEVAKRLDRAIFNTRIGNGIYGGILGASK